MISMSSSGVDIFSAWSLLLLGFSVSSLVLLDNPCSDFDGLDMTYLATGVSFIKRLSGWYLVFLREKAWLITSSSSMTFILRLG